MSVLHVLNGDATREKLAGAGIGGELSVFADVLHEGPVSAHFDDAAAAARARFLAAAGYDSYAQGTRWQAPLDRHADYRRRPVAGARPLRPAAADPSPRLFRRGAPHARTVADLVRRLSGADDLAAAGARLLNPQRGERSAARAGRACLARIHRRGCRRVAGRVDSDTGALPFLHGALVRLLEEYPSTENGLGRLHRRLLELWSEAERAPVELFAANAAREERVYVGDITFWQHLARAHQPLLELAAEGEMDGRLPDGVVRITSAGREVVAGKRDAIALNGIDRWIGGVHLTPDSLWRWQHAQRRLVRA